jgi:hypothetical protein
MSSARDFLLGTYCKLTLSLSMPINTSSVHSFHFTIWAKVRFGGLSHLPEENTQSRSCRAEFRGWQVKACIPEALTDHDPTLGVFVYPPRTWSNKYIGVYVTLSVESLKGEVQASKSFEWKVDIAGKGIDKMLD